MKKFLAGLVLLTIGASFASATTISAKFTWITGTLVAAVKPSDTIQTIVLKVAGVSKTYTDVMVPGDYAVSFTSYPIGTSFTLLAAGSVPFTGTFASGSDILVDPVDDSEGYLYRGKVPVTSVGAISYSIGFPSEVEFGSLLSLHIPEFTIGTYEFKNGLDESIETPIAGFTLTIPTTATAYTFAEVVIPTGVDPQQSFVFEATGNGVLSFNGSGHSGSPGGLWVCGAISGPSSVLTSASLAIGPNGL
jgi:hypothetical protein